jgi:RNA polymerase sigma-70 factor (ECF subfamily)
LQKDLTKEMTDRDLLQRFYQSRDNEWLGVLLQRYTLLLFGVCMKYLKNEEEARDCVQQVFVKTIDELHKYEVHHFKSWLYLVTKNLCLMKLRGQKGKKSVELAEKDLARAEESEDVNSYWEKEKLLEILQQGIEQLQPEQKQCVTLFYLEKRSYQEICSLTGFNNLQVKSHIQNGKRNLRLFVEKKRRQPN